MLRLYQVDGSVNMLASSVHFQSSPIQTALFHPHGKRVFCGGRRRYFYAWDIETGAITKVSRVYGHEQEQRSMEKFITSTDGSMLCFVGKGGWINILSADTGQWIAEVKIDGNVADLKWWPEGDGMTIIGEEGEVWDWDAKARSFCNRWRDEGGVSLTKLSLVSSENRQYCAIG